MTRDRKQSKKIDPVILIDLSYIGPSAAEIVWRSLDPELMKITPTVTHDPTESDEGDAT